MISEGVIELIEKMKALGVASFRSADFDVVFFSGNSELMMSEPPQKTTEKKAMTDDEVLFMSSGE